MRKFLLLTLLSSSFLTDPSYANDENISFIGLDKDGNEVKRKLKSVLFKKRFSHVINAFQSAAISELEKSNHKGISLVMNEIRTGASISGSLGIGSAIKGSFAPGFYVIIKKKSK